jgi:hypothetical protein
VWQARAGGAVAQARGRRAQRGLEEMETGLHLLAAPWPTARPPPPAPGAGNSAAASVENVAKTSVDALAASMYSTAARQAVLVHCLLAKGRAEAGKGERGGGGRHLGSAG